MRGPHYKFHEPQLQDTSPSVQDIYVRVRQKYADQSLEGKTFTVKLPAHLSSSTLSTIVENLANSEGYLVSTAKEKKVTPLEAHLGLRQNIAVEVVAVWKHYDGGAEELPVRYSDSLRHSHPARHHRRRPVGRLWRDRPSPCATHRRGDSADHPGTHGNHSGCRPERTRKGRRIELIPAKT